MTKKIVISTKGFEVEAELMEDERPETCERIWESLPLEGKASLYMQEAYFSIPVEIEPENATPDTEKGDVAYWPEGPAFCVFFGDSQPVSPVNTFARIEDDTEKFADVESGNKITVQKVQE